MFFFKVKSLVSFCTVNYRGAPLFSWSHQHAPLSARVWFPCESIFFFFLIYSHTQTDTRSDNRQSSYRPWRSISIFSQSFLENSRNNTNKRVTKHNETLTTTNYTFRSFHSKIFFLSKKKIERSNGQRLWKLLSSFFSAVLVATLKIS